MKIGLLGFFLTIKDMYVKKIKILISFVYFFIPIFVNQKQIKKLCWTKLVAVTYVLQSPGLC